MLLDTRFRDENADQNGLEESDAFTGRIRLGYQTGSYHGFQVLAEYEGTAALNDEDDYDGFPGSAPDTHSVITDPESAELNRLQILWQNVTNTFVGGRQSIEDLTLAYAWVDQVNRIYGADSPVGALSRLHANAHIIHGSYTGLSFGKLAAYNYYLDVENPGLEDASTNTSGISLTGSIKMGAAEDYDLSYHAEYAQQSDTADSTLDFDADYYHFNAKLTRDPIAVGLGYEVLGSDNGVSVQTPLASLHHFNGFADVFLATPADGLEDFYIAGSCDLPKNTVLSIYYHDFESDENSTDLGDEIDILFGYQHNDNWSATAKYADYDQGDDATYSSTQRFFIQLDYQF